MLFNSLHFAIFFPIVFFLYWRLNHKWQNILLLFSSYYFYGSWSWKFLSLLIINTLFDYYIGLKIDQYDDNNKKRFLIISIVGNLGLLAFFKYFNFFIVEAVNFLNFWGIKPNVHILEIVLPVGISFYTFQSLSYTIDIYRKNIKSTKNLLDYALFVSFFPQLVAGPIERATKLLPQIQIRRKFLYDNLVEGLRLATWGFFMKVVIADKCAIYVDHVYDNISIHNWLQLLLTFYLFAFQIYCDFAGYTNIARGVAKMLGFQLTINFNLPYISKNPTEFWQRWHISLSSWFQDYLYFPLAMRYMRKTTGFLNQYKAHFYAMALIGLWHGAEWTFLIFGIYWGLIIIIFLEIEKYMDDRSDKLIDSKIGRFYWGKGKWTNLSKQVLMFHIILFGWVLFRSKNLDNFLDYINGIISININSFSEIEIPKVFEIKDLILLAFLIVFMEFIQFFTRKQGIDVTLNKTPKVIRYGIYHLVIIIILFFGEFNQNAFIYFQF